MEKVDLGAEETRRLLKVVENLRSLADSVQEVCTLVAYSLSEKEAESQRKKKADFEITLEKVRGVLAEKSRSGHTAAVRAIIQKYGANRLSEISPEDYPAVLAEAEGLL